MNPIRFRNPSSDPDYISVWPNYRNVTQRTEYIKGLYPTQFYKDHIINSELKIQFETTTTYERIISVYKYNSTLGSYQFQENITGTDITPSGWISGDIYSYAFTPTTSGVYRMFYTDAGIESDEFIVHSDEELKKQLVEVQYYNYANDYGMIFYDDVTLKYFGISYITGMLQNIEPTNETSAYVNQTGAVEMLSSSPTHGSLLTLTNVHFSYIENINLIFSCDTLTINGIEYSRPTGLSIEVIEKSDLVNIKIKLVKRTTSYYAQA